MRRELLARALADRAARRPIVIATALEGGAQRLLHPADGARPEDVPVPVWEAAAAAVDADRSHLVPDDAGAEWFLHVFPPPLRVAVVGAGHIAQALCPVARAVGFEVAVIDPRSAFSTRARFPDPAVALSQAWPDEALAALRPDARTAIVTCSHDAKVDDPALAAAVASDAYYIGALGSRRTHAARLERLGARGVAAEALARIRAPVGLDIGARTPAEIALSVVAEAIAELRGPKGR